MMFTKLVTPPAAEPVSLTEVKKHLRLAVSDADAAAYTAEDAKLSALITVASEYVETHTRRALITQTWDAVIDSFPCGAKILLPYPDHQSVTSISYTDESGAVATFTDFDLKSTAGYIKKKYGYSWPAIYPESDITIRFVCGYGNAAAVPAGIKQAILLMVGHLHANPEETVVSYGGKVSIERLPLGVDSLLAGFRRYEL